MRQSIYPSFLTVCPPFSFTPIFKWPRLYHYPICLFQYLFPFFFLPFNLFSLPHLPIDCFTSLPLTLKCCCPCLYAELPVAPLSSPLCILHLLNNMHLRHADISSQLWGHDNKNYKVKNVCKDIKLRSTSYIHMALLIIHNMRHGCSESIMNVIKLKLLYVSLQVEFEATIIKHGQLIQV